MSTAPEGYRFGSDGTLRCEAGSTTLPTLCGWHEDHHWCEACLGFYGMPHDLYSCHTRQRIEGLILPGSSRPNLIGCACRFCVTWRLLGYDAACRVAMKKSLDIPEE